MHFFTNTGMKKGTIVLYPLVLITIPNYYHHYPANIIENTIFAIKTILPYRKEKYEISN